MAALRPEVKAYEDEIVDTLESSNLDALSRNAAEIGIIPRNVKESFDSLDPSVPHPRKLRYLLLHACEQLKANPGLHDVLAKHGVTSAILGKVKQCYNGLCARLCIAEGMAAPIAGSEASGPAVDQNKGQGSTLFSKEHISALTEILSSCWGKWRSIGIGLNLPEQVRANIESKSSVWDIEVCLNKVLYEWIVGGHQHAKAPTLENLKKVLNSRIVGRGSEASQLEDNLKKHGIDLTVKEFNAVPSTTPEVLGEPRSGNISTSAPSAKKMRLDTLSIDIVLLSLDTAVAEGKSTLLEVQAVSTCGGTISYQWMKDGCPLEDDEHYLGSNRNILCINDIILASKGSYTCELKSAEHQAVSTSPIAVTVDVSQFTKVLIDMYCAQPDVQRDAWPPTASKTYVNLALVKQKELHRNDEYSWSTIQGDIDDIVYKKESIEYNPVFLKHKNGAFLLIEGRPGSGKTTLVHKISKDWAQGKSILKGAKLVFLVALRMLPRKANIEMIDVLKLFYHNDVIAHDVLKHIEDVNGEGICFVLDGLDEYKGDESIVFRLIRKEYLQRSMVIVSSRPSATTGIRHIADVYIEVIGFLKHQISEYINSYPFTSGRAEDLLSYLTQHPNILRMCYLPVHVAMVSFLHDRMKSSLPHTECGIYTKFTIFTLLRKAYDQTKHPPLKSLDNLSGDHRKVFMSICKLAFDMIVSQQQIIEVSLSEICTSIDDPSLGLVTIDFTAGLYGYQNMYTFVHLTLQEYLAAYHMSRLAEEEQREVIRKCGQMKHMRVVFKFYCGLASFADQESKFQEVLKMSKQCLFHCQCAFESQQASTCKSVLTGSTELSFKNVWLTPADSASIGYVICNTSHLKSLSLEHCFGSNHNPSLLGCAEILKHCASLEVLHLSDNGIDNKGMRILATGLEQCKSLVHLDLSNNAITDEDPLTECTDMDSNVPVSTSGLDECLKHCSKLKVLHLWGTNIGDEGARVLGEGLKHCRYLSVMNLNVNNISAEGAKGLGEGLKHCSNLSELYLSGSDIGDEGAKGLGEGLKHCSNLSKLCLVDSSIGAEGAKGLGESLKLCSNLSNLFLDVNNIGAEGAKGLGEDLKLCSNLCKLYLGSNNIGAEGAKGLGEGLKHCSNLSLLNLGSNSIGDKGAKGFGEGLKLYSNLSVLYLGSNGIGDEGAKGLGVGLKHCSNLSKLFLGGNSIGVDGAKGLGEGLRHCSNLCVLNLGGNKIGAEGAKGLGEGLKHCSNLCVLNLGGNNIGAEGAKGLGEGLKHCSNLSKLDLQDNKIGAEGAKGLSESLRHCSNLSKLYLQDNKISAEGAKGLSEGLRHCTNLSELYLKSNNIGDKGAKDLFRGLMHCSKLSKLDLCSNNIGAECAKVLKTGLKHCIVSLESW